MKKVISIVFFSLFFLLYRTPVVAISPTVSLPSPTMAVPVDYTLPYPGILPDHPLYLLKVLRDKILGWVISDPVKKVEFNLLMADKRVVMGSWLVEEGKGNLGLSTVSKGEKYLDQAMALFFTLPSSRREEAADLKDRLGMAAAKHKEVIEVLGKKDAQRVREWQAFLDELDQHIQDLEKVK